MKVQFASQNLNKNYSTKNNAKSNNSKTYSNQVAFNGLFDKFSKQKSSAIKDRRKQNSFFGGIIDKIFGKKSEKSQKNDNENKKSGPQFEKKNLGNGTVKTTITYADGSYKTIIKDKEDRRFYEKEVLPTGEITITKTNYNKGFQTITTLKDDKKETRFIDMINNEELAMMDEIHAIKFDELSNLYIVYNIETGQKVKEEMVDENGETVYSKEWSEKTGKVRQIFNTYEDRGYTREVVLHDNGKIKKDIYITLDETEERYVNYSKDGEILSCKTYEYMITRNGNKILKSETEELEPYSDVIMGKIMYSYGEKTEYYYNESPNYVCLSERRTNFKDESLNRLLERTEFYPSGKVKKNTTFKNDGNKIMKEYDEKGQKTVEKTFDANNRIKTKTLYDAETGKLDRKARYRINGIIEVDYYDLETGYIAMTKHLNNKTRKIAQLDVYFPESKQVQFRKMFKGDGSYYQITYNENGEVIDACDYYSTGERKKANETEEEFLARINNQLTSEKAGIMTDEDHERLSQILGVEVKDLEEMPKQVYRTLTKRYHTDSSVQETDEGKIAKYRQIFDIVAAIYKLNHPKPQAIA